jgi:phytoene dehydrogenase-like protein
VKDALGESVGVNKILAADVPLLIEMLLCPLLIYGSAWENDMDFSQFVIMFKSIYVEGFSRPENGVRTIIDTLIEKFISLGGELKFRTGVEKILVEKGKVIGVDTKKAGVLKADRIFSSAGFPETMELANSEAKRPEVGKMSFMETIFITDKKIAIDKFDSTIVFYNNSNKYLYQQASDLYDESSAVICTPCVKRAFFITLLQSLSSHHKVHLLNESATIHFYS